jgi:UDP-N-acetyl-2-amino-2-deoxyglucuronate dehydrogenase
LSESKLKVAVVGCGRVSRTAHYDALKGMPEYDFKAVCDINRERADLWAQKNGVKAYYNIEELLSGEDLDLVSINVPNGLHPMLGMQAAEKGVNVICEKPLGMRLGDVDNLIACCDRNGVRLFTVLQNRYNETNKLLKRSIERGRFGKIFMCNVTLRWRREIGYYTEDHGWRAKRDLAGGVFTNQAVHYIDMMQWLIDAPAESVYAKMDTQMHDIEVETHGSAVLKFGNGVIGSLNLSSLSYPEDTEGSITILGEKGTVKVGGKSMNKVLEWKFADSDPDDEQANDSSYTPPTVYGFGHQDFYKKVADFLLSDEGGEDIIDGREGRKSVELLQALYLSSETSQEVSLPLKVKI